jgi:hypothetical protein
MPVRANEECEKGPPFSCALRIAVQTVNEREKFAPEWNIFPRFRSWRRKCLAM